MLECLNVKFEEKVLTKFRNHNGFTLVELMVVVAIIGLLSSVALPNFRKYQAKSKMSEAKLQLASLYVAESAFNSDFHIYATCLAYMGYDPRPEKAQRYYAMGFGATVMNNVAGPGWQAAINSGMQAVAGAGSDFCQAGMGAEDGRSFFSAGKGTGATIVTDPAHLDGTTPGTGTRLGDHTTGDLDPSVASGMNYRAGAAGVIDGNFRTATNSSFLIIDNRKVITILRNGY